jgi:hypothetical protein
MEYFLLNVNRQKENKVDYWIGERKFAPIFYGLWTIEQIKNKETDRHPQSIGDAELFIEVFEKYNDNAIIFSIGKEYVYIFKQEGKLKELEQHKNKDNSLSLVKGFSIKIIEKILIKESPLILVSIKSNRYMSSGTFRKLKPVLESNSYFGNILSLEYLITNQKQKVKSFRGYLFCLSSVEFETLISKILEEKGYFVSAYRGGSIKDYDLFYKSNEKKYSVQIKLEMEEEHYNETTDYFYCIKNNGISAPNIKNWESIKNELGPKTKEWLKETLYWVKVCEKE